MIRRMCSHEEIIGGIQKRSTTSMVSRVSDRDLTTQDSIAEGEQGGLATEANLERSGFATKLSENRLACCLHTIYYKRPYILLYMRCFYKYME